MKRLTVIAVLSLAGAVLMTSPAFAGTTTSKTTSKVTPKRDKTKPYKFKTTGKVAFPGKFCNPGQTAANCIPLKCPAGVTNAKYCTRPTIAEVCTGTVKIVFKAGSQTRSSKTVNLKPNCTYSSSTTIKKKGKMTVSVKFSGNAILAASSASKKKARAG